MCVCICARVCVCVCEREREREREREQKRTLKREKSKKKFLKYTVKVYTLIDNTALTQLFFTESYPVNNGKVDNTYHQSNYKANKTRTVLTAATAEEWLGESSSCRSKNKVMNIES